MLSRGLRYIPDEDEQLRLRWLWLTAGRPELIQIRDIRHRRWSLTGLRAVMHAATTVKMPTGEQIGLGAASILGPNGVKADEASRQLPHFFYESVHYGITGQNPGAAQVGQSSPPQMSVTTWPDHWLGARCSSHSILHRITSGPISSCCRT